MQIKFDPRDRNACGAVIAAIIGLHGELPSDGLVEITGTSVDHGAVQNEHGFDAMGAFDAPDPAAAFDAPNPAEAFGESGNGAPAAAIPPAPSPAPSPVAPSSGVELDAKGLPWDARIHSGPADKKPKNTDGTWRRKRGTDDALIAQVEAELRQVMGAPPAVPTPPAAPAAVSPEPAPAPAPTAAPVAPPPTLAAADTEHGQGVATPAPTPPPVPPVQPAPVEPPAAPVPPPVPPTPAAGPPTTFADLMRKITAAQTSGTLTVAQTTETAQALGLTAVRDLINRPDLIPSFYAAMPPEAQ